MCCFFSVLLFLGPRAAILIWWLVNPLLWQATFDRFIWPLLGFIFVPWTTLMYVLVAPGGIVFFDQHTCTVDLCSYFLGFCEDESCGRCTTCHGGTQRAVEILRRIQSGGGRDVDFENFQQLVSTLVWSNCFHGQFAMTTVKTAVKAFEDEWREHIFDKRCRAGVCQGLIDYRVRSTGDPALAEAAELCPTGAIVPDGSGYTFDDPRCIRCGACREVAPNAIEVVDRFAVRFAEGAAAGG